MASDNKKTVPSEKNSTSSKRLPNGYSNIQSNSGNSGTTTSTEMDGSSNLTRHKMSQTNYLTNGNTKLPSLMPARDLYLGGRGAISNTTRKVFVPNLNVVRNKNATVKTSKDTTLNRGRGRGNSRGSERGSSRGRGNMRGGHNNSSLIQTTGVFSEGAGDVTAKRSTSSFSYQRNSDDSSTVMRKPTIKKMEQKIDFKAAIAKDHDILKSLDQDDDNDIKDIDEKTDLNMLPVKLSEINVETSSIQLQSQHTAFNQNPVLRYPQNVEEMLATTQPQIFLMQFPDALPCMEEVSAETKDDPASSNENSTIKSSNSSSRNVLKTLEEGQVGRLLRYKSGKLKLVLGETYFDLNMGMDTGFLQDLMSVTTNREERNGNMINLGPIQAKLTATPDWEYLLKKNSPITNKL